MDVLKRFLDAYGEHMEFCQLQVNYLDWTFQNAKEKVELMKEHNIPVWVMEPVRGGKLASLDPENESKLKALRPEESIAAWAFRFLQSVPEVKVVLSGMSNMEQMQENIRTYGEDKPLNKKEMDALMGIAEDMVKKNVVPCTACHYCVDHCTQGWISPDFWNFIMSTRSQEGALSRPWLWRQSRRTNIRTHVSAAEAARQSVPSR